MLDGTRCEVVPSRLFQARTVSRPSIGGIAALLPVATTIALVAVRTSSPTTTRRSPSRRPAPRKSSMPRSSSQGSWPESSRSWITSSRLASVASGSRLPVTACFTPGTRRASASSSPGRSRAFEGMHA